MQAPDWFLRSLENIDPLLFPKLCLTSRGKRWVIYRKLKPFDRRPRYTLRELCVVSGVRFVQMEPLAEQVSCPLEDGDGNFLPLCNAVLRVLYANSSRHNLDGVMDAKHREDVSRERETDNYEDSLAKDIGSYARAKATPHVLNEGVPG